MHCCGNQGHVIELSGGSEPLCLVRCGTCQRREWRLGTATIAPDAAFEVLAQTYRTLPRAARAARERTTTQNAARAAARAAQSAGRPGVEREHLAALLRGWSVLGASA